MPRPRSPLFPYTTLFRSLTLLLPTSIQLTFVRIRGILMVLPNLLPRQSLIPLLRSEERFSRNAETEISTLSLHDALPIFNFTVTDINPANIRSYSWYFNGITQPASPAVVNPVTTSYTTAGSWPRSEERRV